MVKSKVLAVARFAHQRALAERFGARLVLAHEPDEEIVTRVAAETGAELLRPWYGTSWLHGGGVDVIYDTVGSPKTVEMGIRIAAPRGAIVVTGVEAPRRFEWTPLYFKEIHLIGSNAFGHEDFEGSRRHAIEIYLDLVLTGRVDVTPILTHRFTLERYQDAFVACLDQGASGATGSARRHGWRGEGGGVGSCRLKPRRESVGGRLRTWSAGRALIGAARATHCASYMRQMIS